MPYPRALVVIAALLAPLATGAAAPAPAPRTPSLVIPPHRDTISIETPPEPLLEPGRPSAQPPLRPTREQFAREQLQLGESLEQAANPGAAILAYANAVRADSTFPGAAEHLGRLDMQVRRLNEAERMFRLELRHHPANVDASRELALVLSARGRHTEAVDRARRLVRQHPERDDNWYALGLVSADAGHGKEAEAALRRAIALGPERALEHRDLAVLLASQGRAREARGEYRKALGLGDRDPSIWLDLGNLDARTGRADSALAAYREAERRDSSFALAYEAQIKTLERLNRRDAIADTYLRWVTARPDDIDLRLRAVRHLAALGRRDRALEIGRDGVRHDARSPAAHLVLGLALQAYGNTRESLAELRNAEQRFKAPRDRDRVRQLIASMRAAAPDSLRGLFVADSVAHAPAR